MRRDRTPRARGALLAAVLGAAWLAAGCGGLDNEPLPLPSPSFDYFVCAVQPILDRECSAPSCHGTPDRGLQLLSPSRMRITAEYDKARADLSDEEIELGMHPALTDAELSFNYEQCRGFAFARSVDDPPQILSRPLALAAGGIYHEKHGDVFPSKTDPRYLTIQRWLFGSTGENCP